MRSISRLLVAAVLLVWPLSAAAVEYTFTKIVDSSGDFIGQAFGPPALNNGGTAAFSAGSPFFTHKGMFTGSGGPLTTILELNSSLFNVAVPSINDNGTVAFVGRFGFAGDDAILTGSGGPITTIVDTSGPFSGLSFPSINNNDTVAFTAHHDTLGARVLTSSGGSITTIVDESGDFSEIGGFPGINNFGTVAFVAARLGLGGGVFASSGGDPITIADTSGALATIFTGKLSINDKGTVAFVGGLGFGNDAIGTGSGGPPIIIADTLGPFQNFDLNSVSINIANTVVFRASLDAGGSGIYTGPDPVADKVIQTGDPIFGSTVIFVNFLSGGLNDNGQIAFAVSLADGTHAVFRADPVEEAPAPEATAGNFTGYSVIDGIVLPVLDANYRDLPTIIVTHGWQPKFSSTGACNFGTEFTDGDDAFANGVFPLCDLTGTFDMLGAIDMLGSIMGRAIQERIFDNLLSFNVFEYRWRAAYQPLGGFLGAFGNLQKVLDFSPLAGQDLADQIQREFQLQTGIPHNQPFHFVGHSAGTLVNTHAVNVLSQVGMLPEATQLTMLDAPMDFPIGVPAEEVDANFFYSLLPQGTAQYVDNFFGDRAKEFSLLKPFLPGVGDTIAGAAPVDQSEQFGISHEEMHSEFYSQRIFGPEWITPVLVDAYANRPDPPEWIPLSGGPLRRIPGPDARLALDGGLGWRQISETGFVDEVDDFPLDGVLFTGLSVAETSPVSISHPVTVPIDATVFNFDFHFLNKGDGDWLSLSFNTNPLWSALGESFFTSEPLTISVPIASVAGQTGDLTFTLHGVGEPNAEVLLGNFEFLVFPMLVDIDIKPRRDPNLIRTGGGGKIVVAILSSPDFNAPTDVDQGLLTFGALGDEQSLASCAKKAKDVDGNGLLDLLCRFNKATAGFLQGDISGVLKGQTLNGVPFIGTAVVEIVAK